MGTISGESGEPINLKVHLAAANKTFLKHGEKKYEFSRDTVILLYVEFSDMTEKDICLMHVDIIGKYSSVGQPLGYCIFPQSNLQFIAVLNISSSLTPGVYTLRLIADSASRRRAYTTVTVDISILGIDRFDVNVPGLRQPVAYTPVTHKLYVGKK